jgi:ribosomal protein S18 acetylase RimI-like enzyme
VKTRRITADEAYLWSSAVEKLLYRDGQGSPISIDDAADALSDSRCYLIVTENESGVVGLLSAYRFPNVTSGGEIVYLYDIEVQEQFRNRGFGRSMIDELLRNCRLDRVESVWAGTDTANTPARKSFEHSGASLVGDSYVEYEWRL